MCHYILVVLSCCCSLWT